MAKRLFKRGDEVTWSSQARGTWARKTGTVLAVALEGKCVGDVLSGKKLKEHKLSRADLHAAGEDRYVISVPDGPRKPYLYAPSVRIIDSQQEEAR